MAIGIASSGKGFAVSDFSVALILALAFIGTFKVFRTLADPGTGGS